MTDDSGSTRPPVHLILGATGGIGSALSRHLAASGARLLLAARNGDRLAALASELDAPFLVLDATRTDEVERAARDAHGLAGGLDGIANCVGSLLLKPAHLTTPDEWRTTLDLNLGTAFAAVRAAGKVMRQGGSVVLMSSAAARVGLSNHEAIAAAKAGVAGLARAAAASYASRGLRVNAVAPGLIRTPMTERITSNEASLQTSLSMHALGRLGEPDEVARTLAWLLGPDSGWVTGQVIGLDGGLATVRTR